MKRRSMPALKTPLVRFGDVENPSMMEDGTKGGQNGRVHYRNQGQEADHHLGYQIQAE